MRFRPQLGRLANLTSLALWGNELSGPIPGELGALVRLATLSLSRNRLSGPIPGELCRLSALRFLFLWGNRLTGADPEPSSAGCRICPNWCCPTTV